jgi:hypothetical protein
MIATSKCIIGMKKVMIPATSNPYRPYRSTSAVQPACALVISCRKQLCLQSCNYTKHLQTAVLQFVQQLMVVVPTSIAASSECVTAVSTKFNHRTTWSVTGAAQNEAIRLKCTACPKPAHQCKRQQNSCMFLDQDFDLLKQEFDNPASRKPQQR